MDVTEQSFQADVLDRSATETVLVDFWAEWCGPCKQLTPVLEAAVAESQAAGRPVTFAKVDVDAHKELARRFQVSGIPAVKAFRGGEVVAEFVGAKSRPAVEAFLEELTRPPLAESLDDEEVAAVLRDGNYERAFEILLGRAADPARRDDARRLMVDLFAELGQAHPLAVAARKKLAALLY